MMVWIGFCDWLVFKFDINFLERVWFCQKNTHTLCEAKFENITPRKIHLRIFAQAG